jgi:peptidoglycan hydrolase-like protein with peptidoglycan-binding domain
LVRGSRGTSVEVVQKRLNAIDFWCGKADGKFGRKTANAVKQLQRAVLLPVDGRVSVPVWKAMWDPKVPDGL